MFKLSKGFKGNCFTNICTMNTFEILQSLEAQLAACLWCLPRDNGRTESLFQTPKIWALRQTSPSFHFMRFQFPSFDVPVSRPQRKQSVRGCIECKQNTKSECHWALIHNPATSTLLCTQKACRPVRGQDRHSLGTCWTHYSSLPGGILLMLLEKLPAFPNPISFQCWSAVSRAAHVGEFWAMHRMIPRG